MSELEKFVKENAGLIRTALYCAARVSSDAGYDEQANDFNKIAEELSRLVFE